MLRIVVLVLVAANVLYFGWSRWVGDADPDLTAVAAAPRQPQAAKPAAPPPPPPCATIGPFINDVDTLAAEQKLTAAGWGVLRRAVAEQQREGYWVYVTHADSNAQARTLNALRAAGIRDAFAMPDDPEHKVSVGIFNEEERAEDRAQRVQRLKLDAMVQERLREQTVTWLDIPGVARETLADGRLEQSGLQLERLRIEACPVAPQPDAAAASAPADAAPAAPADGSPRAATP
jgi:hypothetical protein